MLGPIRCIGMTLLVCTAACGSAQPITAAEPNQQPLLNWSVPVNIASGNLGAYPRLVRLADGSLIGSQTTFVGNVHHLVTSRSTDNGQSFQDLGEIAEGTGDLDNVHIVQLPSGRLLAAFRNHSYDNGTVYRITVCRSDDGGATWAFHSEVEHSGPPNGIWEPFLFNAPDGSLQVYYAREYAANDQDIVMRRSYDGGVTWGGLQTVAGAGLLTRDGMPGVTTYWDGNQSAMIVIFESFTNGNFQVMHVKSLDSGASFYQREAVHTPPAGKNAGSPQIAATWGHLVASFMTDEDSSQQGWPNFAAVKIATSAQITPNGISWNWPNTVANASAYWPGVLGRDQGSVFVTYNAQVTWNQIDD